MTPRAENVVSQTAEMAEGLARVIAREKLQASPQRDDEVASDLQHAEDRLREAAAFLNSALER